MSEWPAYPEPGGFTPSNPEPEVVHLPVPAGPMVPNDLAAHYASLGQTRENPVTYSAGGSTFRKTGHWVVPPYIRIRGGLGTVILDMQRAVAAASMIGVEVSGGAGSILLVVPEGWGADISQVSPGIGSRRCLVSETPAQGYPFLYVTGSLMIGSFTIRHPNRWDLWRLKREMKKESKQRLELER